MLDGFTWWFANWPAAGHKLLKHDLGMSEMKMNMSLLKGKWMDTDENGWTWMEMDEKHGDSVDLEVP